MESFRLRPVTEADLDQIVCNAGGARAHSDAERRDRPGADYRLGNAIIELKSLDDEGFSKPERQHKLASLFGPTQPGRPVVVLDSSGLPPGDLRRYDRIVEGPVKSAVAKGRQQLAHSKRDHPDASACVLMIVNNGYGAIDHEELVRIAAHRVRSDSTGIDGLVVAGCYYYTDGYEGRVLWPIDYIPMTVTRPFAAFDALRSAWNAFANAFMTRVVTGEVETGAIKRPVDDLQFDVNGVTYVKPAPRMGVPSEFYGAARPRRDSRRPPVCPTVARTFPDLRRREWERFRAAGVFAPMVGDGYQDWLEERSVARAAGDPLEPLVPMEVTYDDCAAWCASNAMSLSIEAMRRFANDQFEHRVRAIFEAAREISDASLVVSRYVSVTTQVIGQDAANDVSDIAVVREQVAEAPLIRALVSNQRITHEHALLLGCAYAIAERVDAVRWYRDLRYAWA
ncbi:MAG: hypothetical protein U0638_12540 [Phycisphaerales bacterium]